jgi:membrane protein DedA with SNARE-associated domain
VRAAGAQRGVDPAGIARMPLARFCLYTVIGAGLWNALFIYLGSVVGDNYERVESYVKPFSYAVLLLLVAGAAYLVVRTHPAQAVQRRRLTSGLRAVGSASPVRPVVTAGS